MDACSGHVRCHFAADHPAFAGHFPGRPIVPGVALLDAAVHAIATATGHRGGWQLGAAKFIRALGPDSTVDIHWQAAATAGTLNFTIRCGEDAVASGSLSARPQA